MRRITISLPDGLHEKLQRDAGRAKISMAELIWRLLERSNGGRHKRRSSEDPILKVAGICKGPILSRDIDESLYGR